MSFLSSLTTKAQSAWEESPLSSQVQQLQSKLGGSGHKTGQPSANEAAAQGGIADKNPLLGNITHQFRTMQMQYS